MGGLSDPVSTGVTSSANSSSTIITAGQSFTGQWQDVGDFGSAVIAVKTDQDGYFEAQFSPDGTNADSTLTRYYRTADINAPCRFTIARRYFRVRFFNTSASNQTYFRLQTLIGDKPDLNIPTDAVMAQRYDSISVRPTDYTTEVALGRRQNQTTWNKWGYNDDIDAAAAETIWAPGGLLVPLTTARTLSVVSTSVNDDSAGTGARSIVIYGVDANWQSQTVVVTMDGTTPVVTAETWLGINRMAVYACGSLGYNDGLITATATTDNTTQGTIPAQSGSTQQAFFFVQAGHTALADWLWINTRKLAGGTAPRVTVKGYVTSLVSRAVYEVFRADLDTAVENTLELSPKQPFVVGEKSLLEFRATTNTNDTVVNVRFSLIEHKNVAS